MAMCLTSRCQRVLWNRTNLFFVLFHVPTNAPRVLHAGLFCFLLVCCWVGTAFGQSTVSSVCDTTKSKNATMRSLGAADVHWTKGFWKSYQDLCAQKMVPSMKGIMTGTQRSHFFENFRIATGISEGKHRGAPWNDGDFYKWLEAAVSLQAISQKESVPNEIAEMIRIIGVAQRDDGYIHTPLLIEHRNGNLQPKPFEDRQNFETYNLGHLITAACVHKRVTGRNDFLNLAIKAADYLDRHFSQPDSALARNAVCPSHYMALVELYRVTGNQKYLNLARRMIQLRDFMKDGGDDNQDRVPLGQQREIVGHAVRANYLYAGVADLCLEQDHPDYRQMLDAVWKNMTQRKMYITGSCGALFDGASPEGSKDQKSITKVHQAYGRNFQLPNNTAHNETCAAIGNAMWCWRMLQLTGDCKYADTLERVLYNALPAGVGMDGESYFYTNTLRQLDDQGSQLRWSRTRQQYISCFCCPPNLVRMIAQLQNYACCVSSQALYFNLYGSCEISTILSNGEKLACSVTTNYPWDGEIQVKIISAPASPTSFFFRIPDWADDARVTVNGKSQPFAVTPGKYSEVKRKWGPGEIIRLQLNWKPQWVQAHPLVEEARNQVALVNGPVVYCLESPDLPAGKRIQEMHAFRGAVPGLEMVKEPWMNQPLQTFRIKLASHPEKQWEGKLYQPLGGDAREEVTVRMIPYFAWSNRGKSEMTVWIPLEK